MSRLRFALPHIYNLVLVAILFGLDVRDLHYKIAWIGPYDTFSFYAISSRTFDNKTVVVAKNFTHEEAEIGMTDSLLPSTTRQSGWPSLLASCSRFNPAGAFLFIGGMGEGCTVYNHSGTEVVVPQLYMSASLRADSMAWAACKLLYRHRKPAVCHDHIVTGFLDRYGIQDREITRNDKVLPYSDGENEVLGVLRVIAKSEPIERATCVEGFAFTGPGFYTTTIYGCGAPNSFDSAFVGTFATAFATLHQDKAWLTVDTLNFMGLKYLLRQNVKSEFTATVDNGAILFTPKTVTNFSSSGGLYDIMIAIDVIVLIINLLSSLEITRAMIIPFLYTRLTSDQQEVAALNVLVEDYRTGFTNSLYRSRVIVVLMAASQLLSWMIMLPNSIIFTWSTSSKLAKLQAYLSSLRLWVLILLLFNETWDWVVRLNESLAFHVTSFTFITPYEIMGIGAIVSYVMRQEVFTIGNAKYALENQRTKDTTSFVNRMTLQNSYNESLDFHLSTPSNIVWIIYKPLFDIIGWSCFFCVLVILVRYIYYRQAKPILLRKLNPGGRYATGKILARSNAGEGEEKETADDDIDFDRSRLYERLPLEEALNEPIRARMLVRVSYAMETIRTSPTTKRPKRYILPAYFLEHGVLVDQRGQMRTRHGFFKFLEPNVRYDECVPSETMEALRTIDTLRKRASGAS